MKLKNGKVKLEIDLLEVIEFEMSDKDRIKLIEYILYSLLKTKNIKKVELKLLDGILEDAMENYSYYEDIKDSVEILKNHIKNIWV